MQQMRLESRDSIAENIRQVAALFPDVVTEGLDSSGATVRTVDFAKLRRLLSYAQGQDATSSERYEFTWVGKQAAIAQSLSTSHQTLRPCLEESRDWDTTENLYLEGDNLEVLKLLEESYREKIKLIYIDPPYNTGTDFVYQDNFTQSREEYAALGGRIGAQGERLYRNTDTFGRFHSLWCSMMYARLSVARRLLAPNGVIMVSIDENEQENLGKLLEEIFGRENLVECLVFDKKAAAKGVPPANMVVGVHEYIYVYAKSHQLFSFLGEARSAQSFANPDQDPRGPWRNTNLKSTVSSRSFAITDPETGISYTDTWAFTPEQIAMLLEQGRLIFPKSGRNGGKGKGQVRVKEYLAEFKNANIPIKSSLGLYDAQWNTQMLSALMGQDKLFQNPKHLRLMCYLLQVTLREGIVLDFFSGSATTGHAVMQLNAQDGGRRRFILVQLPEPCEPQSAAFRAGYADICAIGRERLRRAGDAIQAQLNRADSRELQGCKGVDIGFRVLRLDSGNRPEALLESGEYTPERVLAMAVSIKADRTDWDLVYGCLLEWGLPLTSRITTQVLEGAVVYAVNDGALLACFEPRLSMATVKALASAQPQRMVWREHCFADTRAKLNAVELFKSLSPATELRIL